MVKSRITIEEAQKIALLAETYASATSLRDILELQDFPTTTLSIIIVGDGDDVAAETYEVELPRKVAVEIADAMIEATDVQLRMLGAEVPGDEVDA